MLKNFRRFLGQNRACGNPCKAQATDAYPEQDRCRAGDGRQEDYRASVAAGRDPAPVFQPSQHVLNPVAVAINPGVVWDDVFAVPALWMQGAMLLSFKPLRNQSASQPRSASIRFATPLFLSPMPKAVWWAFRCVASIISVPVPSPCAAVP